MSELALTLLIPIAFIIFSTRRLLTYLHVYQQEEYDTRRFLRWMLEKRAFDKRLTVALAAISALMLVMPPVQWIGAGLLAASFLVFALRESDPRRNSKKKLILTPRARRILALALFFNAVMAAGAAFPHIPLFWIVPVQIIPFTLALANFALKPLEDTIQKKFRDEARAKITEMNPTVIGITGSFGKTSVKHILGHILGTVAPTLITPGSVNTPMGIARIVREQLEPRHKYAVIEMGAYGPGSIARLCQLTPPDFGAVTAIGHAHYERFKTLETVATAKFEMADAVASKGGQMVVHEDTLRYEKPGALHKERPDMFTIVGTGETAHVRIVGNRQTGHGIQVDIVWQGERFTLEAPLYGSHHGTNMAIAFGIACNLGLPVKHVLTALKTTPQIAHRLEIKPRGAKGLLIDDAYNSNPSGFRAALDMLDFLANGRRRILITPGMVELGKAHDEEHEKLGDYAARKTDIVIVVQPQRIRSFVEACSRAETGFHQTVGVDSFAQAQTWLAQNGHEDDVILLENDLPDIYEKLPRL
ncbi:MAG: UDP-N-acetylmuramoyl-tripeptide--D-alanyl-D-alanine ligase [Alphaproteobacteria bacterium]|nr:UDP-N-acetylmuramoyl-tripeptide--D-alanyl-D-alanine ligase [Alphaproteobacteria bacterium]